ncbi:MAG: DUF779 domain-containing protein [Rhodospirillales bacterium]|nr:DUF779 domain-containing protein [Rhodospirillales bacterium]
MARPGAIRCGGVSLVDRVIATPEAVALIERLKLVHGPLMFHQSGGCCDGSAPMCYPAGEFRVGGADILLGALAGSAFWMWGEQYAFFTQSQLIIDVVPGRGSGFSLESPEGVRFLTRSRLFTDDELAELDRAPPPRHGDQPAA